MKNEKREENKQKHIEEYLGKFYEKHYDLIVRHHEDDCDKEHEGYAKLIKKAF